MSVSEIVCHKCHISVIFHEDEHRLQCECGATVYRNPRNAETPTHDFGALAERLTRAKGKSPISELLTATVNDAIAALRAAEEQAKRMRELDQRMIEASQFLAGPPVFRDFTGTDEKTCGYCHAPLEGYSTDGAHAPDCRWVKALARLLASPTPENET